MRRALEDKIVERQKRQTELDAQEAEIERERIRLEGEIAAYLDVLTSLSAMPDLSALDPKSEGPPHTGEIAVDGQITPSRLSSIWFKILREAVIRGNGTVDIDDILEVSRTVGTPMERGTARSQMASRHNSGDFIRTDPGVFQITEIGRSILGLPVRE
jgi:hypothetical protein